MEDKELIYQIQHGKKQYLENLIQKYYDDVYHFCYYKTGNSQISYDLTQETFLKLIKYIGSYKHRGKFKSYLITIALNVCNSYFYNINAKMEFSFSSNEQNTGLEDNNFKTTEKRDVIKQALDKLNDKQREVIILKYYMNFKIKEIANIQGDKVATVKSRLKQSLDKMNKFLKKEDFYEE